MSETNIYEIQIRILLLSTAVEIKKNLKKHNYDPTQSHLIFRFANM